MSGCAWRAQCSRHRIRLQEQINGSRKSFCHRIRNHSDPRTLPTLQHERPLLVAALLADIGIKDYLYGVALAALLAIGVYERNHLIDEGEHKAELAEVHAADKANAAAEKRVAKLDADYKSQLTELKSTHEKELATITAQHDSDAQRLRDYDAYRTAHNGIPSQAGGPGTETAGAGSPVSDEQRYESLELVALQLATAGKTVSSALTACMADRDALTGK